MKKKRFTTLEKANGSSMPSVRLVKKFFSNRVKECNSLRGFTLIEVILSVFILSAVLVGILSFLPALLKLSKKNLEATYVSQLGQRVLEKQKQQERELETGVYPLESSAPCSFEAPYSKFAYRVYVEEDENISGLLKITVRIYWEENSKSRYEDFLTQISR